VERAITESVKEKVFEQIERTEHLVLLVPTGRLHWAPQFPAGAAARDLGQLLGHLLDCLAGFCAAFAPAFPEQLADFGELRRFPVNQFCSPEQARKGIHVFAGYIERGFNCCSDQDLARRVPTLFVSQGETLLTLLLGNLEHLINHKYQLFLHLKLGGVGVGTQDIYHFRGAGPASP
jgi:hypothetical protein